MLFRSDENPTLKNQIKKYLNEKKKANDKFRLQTKIQKFDNIKSNFLLYINPNTNRTIIDNKDQELFDLKLNSKKGYEEILPKLKKKEYLISASKNNFKELKKEGNKIFHLIKSKIRQNRRYSSMTNISS